MGKFTEYQEILRLRYVHLYGKADCDAWMKQERKKMITIIIVIVLLFLALIINDISAEQRQYINVQTGQNGEITSVMRPEKGEDSISFSSRATIITEDGPVEKEYYITIEPAGDNYAVTDSVFSEIAETDTAVTELNRLVSALNDDTSLSEVVLPEKLESGETIIWNKTENTDPVIYFIGALALLWLIYHNRFYAISKEEKRARESIIKELPEFINKLVLLINAGVVLNSAFLKIVDDCNWKKSQDSYFYSRITGIGHMVRETNASFHQELYTFAKYSGVKELMRITNIMLDNISKGDDLSDKLRRENELLWFARKQQAEEKGKLAETKLTLPLMILLTVLIMVTIAPALMEM